MSTGLCAFAVADRPLPSGGRCCGHGSGCPRSEVRSAHSGRSRACLANRGTRPGRGGRRHAGDRHGGEPGCRAPGAGVHRKEKIAKFAAGFQGLHDYFLQDAFVRPEGDPAALPATPDGAGILPSIAEQTVVLCFNDSRALERLRRDAGDIACVIIELVRGDVGGLRAEEEFLQELRAVCDESGVLPVGDEVIAGFRFGLSSAPGLYGIKVI